MNPGRTVCAPRSISVAPAGAESASSLTRPASTTITTFSRTFWAAISSSRPALIAVSAAGSSPEAPNGTSSSTTASTRRIADLLALGRNGRDSTGSRGRPGERRASLRLVAPGGPREATPEAAPVNPPPGAPAGTASAPAELRVHLPAPDYARPLLEPSAEQRERILQQL